MRKQIYILLVSLIFVLVFSACGGGDKKEKSGPAGGQPTATAAPAAAATSTQPSQEAVPTNPPATEMAEPTAEPSGEEAGPGVVADLLNLGTLKTDIKELSSEVLQSYRLRAQWRTEPKEGSTATASTFGIEVAHTREPLAEDVVMRSDESGSDSHMIRIEDRMWFNTGDQWIEMSSGDASTYEDTLFNLDSATAGLTGDAKLVGEETMNGIETRHYTFDDSILGTALGIYSKIKGDVWVAVDGDYTVKYVFSAEDQDATYSWDWEVYDINAPFVIEAPADAQTVREDIPIMADATDRASFGTMLSYSTASDLETTVEFYQTEMAAQGWTYDEASSMVIDQLASLSFNKDSTTASVMISPMDGGGASVVVQTGE